MPLEVSGRTGYTLVRSVASQERRQQSFHTVSSLWQLNGRQTATLEGVMKGLTNKEIALDCAEVTVERYMTLLFRGSGAGTRMELLSWLYAH